MLRSLSLITINLAILSVAFYYRETDGAAPPLMVLAGTCAVVSIMLEYVKIIRTIKEKQLPSRKR